MSSSTLPPAPNRNNLWSDTALVVVFAGNAGNATCTFLEVTPSGLCDCGTCVPSAQCPLGVLFVSCLYPLGVHLVSTATAGSALQHRQLLSSPCLCPLAAEPPSTDSWLQQLPPFLLMLPFFCFFYYILLILSWQRHVMPCNRCSVHR